MRKPAILLLTLCAILLSRANDSVYFGSGNQLVPLEENDIAITREVLVITLTDTGRAHVDVLYELWNRGVEKTILMGFEADAPYNGEDVAADGRHPNFHNFRVTFNGESLTYNTAVVKPGIADGGLQKIKNYGEILASPDWENYGHVLVNQKSDTCIHFACAYYFPATFRAGKNVVHHTYEYDVSYGIDYCFDVPYKLTPAKRWANHRINDFVLRITTPSAKHFFIRDDSTFHASPFRVVEGAGKVRHTTYDGVSATEVTLRNGTLEWHATDFSPRSELDICSADLLMREEASVFYDRAPVLIGEGEPTFPLPEDARVRRNLPYAHRGYVFRDKRLDAFFRSLWWYMPDPTWHASTKDFKPWEQKLLKTKK